MAQHVHRKSEQTLRQRQEERTRREWFQQNRPTMQELLASGEFNGPVPMSTFLDLKILARQLRCERER
jgi:hypothetical protein